MRHLLPEDCIVEVWPASSQGCHYNLVEARGRGGGSPIGKHKVPTQQLETGSENKAAGEQEVHTSHRITF